MTFGKTYLYNVEFGVGMKKPIIQDLILDFSSVGIAVGLSAYLPRGIAESTVNIVFFNFSK